MKTVKQFIKMIILLLTISGYGQYINQEIIGSFHIQNGMKDGMNIQQNLLDQKAKIIFYRDSETGELMMCNYWTKDNTQSFGKISSIHKEVMEATSNNYPYEEYLFEWNFQNTYDEKKGTAQVKLLVVQSDNETLYQITIVPKDLKVLLYIGLEETLTPISKTLDNEL